MTSDRYAATRVVQPALVLLITYLVFVGGGWHGIHVPALRIASATIVGLVLLVWTAVAARNSFWLPGSALLPAFIVALGAFIVGVTLSQNPRLGLEYLGWSILLTGLYLLLVRLLAHAAIRSRLMTVVVILTIVHGSLYLVQTGASWIEWWQLVGRITTPPLRPAFGGLLLGNPSAVMTVQVLLSVASLAWIGWANPSRRAVSALLLGLAVTVTIVSGSRSGWFAVGAAAVIATVIWMSGRGTRRLLRNLVRSRTGAMSTVATGAAAVVAVVVLAPAVLQRAGAGGEAYRLANYAEALRMFADEPIHGVGPGMWVSMRIRYTVPPEPDYYIPYAHNLPLQTMAEFGLVGAAAGVVVATLLLRLIWAATRHPDGARRRFGWAALFGVTYFIAHQLLDFYGNLPAAMFAFVVPIAYLDATHPRAGATRRSALPAALGAAVGAVCVPLLLVVESTAATALTATRLADEGRWADALPLAQEAVDRDPAVPAYQFSLAVIASHAGRPEIADQAYRLAAEADDLPASWLGVAAGHVRAGDVAAAEIALKEALRVGHQQAAILVAAADLYLRLDNSEAAIDALAGAVALAPSLAGDNTWKRDARLARLHDPVIAIVRPQLGGTSAIDLALAMRDFPSARRVLPSLPAETRDLYALVIRGWEGNEAAAVELMRRAEERPLNIETVRQAARLASYIGDEESAMRLRAWLEIVNGFSSLATHRVLFAGDDIHPQLVAGLASIHYGQHTYRRPTPFDQIPAGLLQLRLR